MGKPESRKKEARELFERIKRVRLIALLAPGGREECLAAYELCEDEGIILEIAFRTSQAEAGIGAIRAKYPGALVLAGTVLTPAQVEAAVSAGAAGIVSPDYIPDVVAACLERGVMCVPGGLSDAGKQLVQKAALLGCSMEDLPRRFPEQWIYKLFPAVSGEGSHFGLAKAWRGPFKDLTVIYTGGINRDTLSDALRADPDGIFCGTALARDPGSPERMREEIRAWKAVLEQGTSKPAVSSGRTAGAGPAPGIPAKIHPPGRVVTFGEMMLRLSPPDGVRLAQTREFALDFGGAEANAAVSLAGFGREAVFVSAFPDNDLGDNAVGVLRRHGVITDFILRQGSRMGIYFLEPGSGPRASRVVYDRAGSALARLRPGDIDWKTVFAGADWFHWTGITPALGEPTADLLEDALGTARSLGITVSVDLNYRRKLWSEGRARAVLSKLMPYVDVCIGNEEDASRVFGIRPRGSDIENGRIDPEGFRILTEELRGRFGFKRVAVTLRENLSASENYWSACLLGEEGFLLSRRHRVWVLDRVGSGDAFAAGLIHGLMDGRPDREALEFGVAAAVLKHSIRGDFNLISAQEAEGAAEGRTKGRILR